MQPETTPPLPALVIQVDQERAEACLGASEAAGVLGLDKYSPAIKVWRKLRGLPMRDDSGEPAMWGTLLEPVIRGHYAVTRRRRILVPTRSMILGGWLRCTPDGIDVGESEHGGEVVAWNDDGLPPHALNTLQIKTCNEYLGDDWRDGPPPKYEIQCRVELAVTGLPHADIVCLVGGQHLVGPFRLLRDLKKERRILDSLREFMTFVERGIEPTVDHTDAWRLHASEKMESARPVMVRADAAFVSTIVEWRAARAAAARAHNHEAELGNRILLHLSAAGATRADAGEHGRITAYRTPKNNRWVPRAPLAWSHDV